MKRTSRLPLLLLPIVVLGACSHDTTSSVDAGIDAATSNPGDLAGADLSGAPADLATPGPLPLIVTIVLENHDYAEIVGSPNAPYINSLIAAHGLATNYLDSGTHPSLPNYLYMISGDTQYPGVVDLLPTQSFITGQFPVQKPHLGSQLQAAGIPWRAYQESMGTPCRLTNSGSYAPKHDPFLYFDDIQNGAGGLCASRNVDYTSFAADLAAGTYRYMWITPNLNSDGHDPTADPVMGLKQSDDWCKTEIPKILASPTYQAGGVLLLTWDEAEGRSGAGSSDRVPMIVMSTRLKSAGMTSSTAFSHASYLATVEDLYKLPRLGAAVSASSLTEFLQ